MFLEDIFSVWDRQGTMHTYANHRKGSKVEEIGLVIWVSLWQLHMCLEFPRIKQNGLIPLHCQKVQGSYKRGKYMDLRISEKS